MLTKFNNLGCMFSGMSVSAVMFADDLVILSPSIGQVQIMLDLCCKELALLDLQINSKKSAAIRIGCRFKNKCVALLR